jgi:hypothetical protein
MEARRCPAARADGVRCNVWMDVARYQREGNCLPTVGVGVSGYRRHCPEDTVFYGVVEQHAEAFFEVAKASKMVRYRGSCARSSKRICAVLD